MKKQKYTIVELLAVIVIMAIIAAAGVPAFWSLFVGNRMEQTAKKIEIAISKARSEAILKGTQVALLLPVRRSSNHIRREYLHHAYAIVVLKDGKFDTNNNDPFKWNFFSGGSTFYVPVAGSDKDEDNNPISHYYSEKDDDYFVSSNSDLPAMNQDALGVDTINLLDSGDLTGGSLSAKDEYEYKKAFEHNVDDDDAAVNYIIFNPDGSVKKHCDLNFFVFEGFVNANGYCEPANPGSKKERPLGAIGMKLKSLTGGMRYYEEL